jgi:hypothetical protein
MRPRRWFVLCLFCITYLVLVQVSEIENISTDLTQLSRFCLKTETESGL